MHTDEAINAYITGHLLTGGAYHYDPQDRHGPALYALALPLARLCGAKNLASLTETTVRLGPILTGTLAVFLFLPLVQELGLGIAFIAALLWAIAPLPLYYSRYFIHETMFVAATLGLLTSGWRWLNTGSVLAAVLAGFWAALMLACKETAVLSFAAAFAAGMVWLLLQRTQRTDVIPRLFALSGGFIDKNIVWQPEERRTVSASRRWTGLGLALGFALVLLLLFYSWGGRNWSGVSDLARAMPRFVNRAGGEGHEKAWWYYLRLLVDGWSGWCLCLLAVIGAITALSSRFSGALACWFVYGVAITIIYSVIPYKTPWLALNLFLPLAVLAGAGLMTLCGFLQKTGTVWPIAALAAVLLLLIGHDTRQRVFRDPSDEKNPYAYAHTGEDITRLPERLDQLVRPQSTIAVIEADPWPLPWYLRKYPRVGYWQPGQTPGPASFYLTSTDLPDSLKDRLKGWRYEFFGVRPGVLLLLWTPPT